MTTTENLLIILMEECDETSQRASKALRFTLGEIQPEQDLTNAQRIVYEFNDIVAVMELLWENGVLDHVTDRSAVEAKKQKVKKYLEHSKNMGVIAV